MTTRNEAAHGRFSLTESKNRPPGSVGRCRKIDITWLIRSLSEKKRKWQAGRNLMEENKLVDDLMTEGFTVGLARTLVRSTDSFALRIWLVDNSGSMNNVDGNLVVQSKGPSFRVQNVKCTRWEEVTSALLWHAKFSAKMKAPMVVRLVNDPGANIGPQQLGVVASENVSVDSELNRLHRLLKQSHPGGNTPLTVHLKEILESLRDVDPILLKENWISLVIVTDSLPRDGQGEEGQDVNFEFLETLKEFQDYPVWIVIRLSTDEQRVIDFYSSLDKGIVILRQLHGEADHATVESINLDVLDDFVSEAYKVTKYNPWLNYGLPLHLTRESGVTYSSFDVINERPLVYAELADFVALLFDRQPFYEDAGGRLQMMDDRPLPNPQTSYYEFRREVHECNERCSEQWDPVKKRMLPWINLKVLDRIYRSGAPVTNATVAADTTCYCQIL
jgi:hypothetical protein